MGKSNANGSGPSTFNNSNKSGGIIKKKSKAKMYYQKKFGGGGRGRGRGGRGGGGGGRGRRDEGGNSRGTSGGGGDVGERSSGWKRPSKLDFGMKGFLCTTNFNEKNAVKEAYNLLNEYHRPDYDDAADESSNQVQGVMVDSTTVEGKESDSGQNTTTATTTSSGSAAGLLDNVGDERLRGDSSSAQVGDSSTSACNRNPVNKSDESDEDEDIESALAAEINQLKSSEVKFKFQSVDTGVPNLIFINTKISNPVTLAQRILEDLNEKKEQKSRFLLRMIPIEAVCRAEVSDIQKECERILPKYFKVGFNSFQIVYKSRYNNSMNRGEVIKVIAETVMKINSFNSVNLTEPKLSIIVEIMRGLCCLGVAPNFVGLRKYNLIEVATPKSKEEESSSTTGAGGAPKDEAVVAVVEDRGGAGDADAAITDEPIIPDAPHPTEES